ERAAAATVLLRHGGAQEVVRLETGLLAVHDPGRSNEDGEQVELLEQVVVEDATCLVARQEPVPVGRLADRVPADDDSSWRLCLPETEQHRGEPRKRIPGATVAAPIRRRWERVVCAVRERVAVDDEQRAGHLIVSSSAWMAVINLSVASCATSP